MRRRLRATLLPWCLLALASLAVQPQLTGAHALKTPAKRNHITHNYYVVEHKSGADRGSADLSEVVQHLGVELVEQVGELEDIWLVRAPKQRTGAVDSAGNGDAAVVDAAIEASIADDDDDEGLDLEELVKRGAVDDPVVEAYRNLKRAASLSAELESRSPDLDTLRRLASSITHLEKQHRHTLVQRAPAPAPPLVRPPPSNDAVIDKYGIKDQFFSLQWHIANDRYPENMMNVTPVWDMGYTGKGVVTGLIDDGLDYTSEDLKDNFDAKNSYDFNDHEPMPFPKRASDHHGTRCAGQIAAAKNDMCGVGLAFNSKVSGIRILGGRITTVDEAAALNYGFQDVSIYSCSWGPRDDGTKMQAPPYIVNKAVLNGINKGRGGKGSVFVFASGNGAHKGDECNFDGYTNSIWSITVGAVDYKGLHPKYSEACAANLVVGFSSGSGDHIVTTDKGVRECAFSHGGTSAAAPNVAGVIALALEARPDLTWRDVQYLVVNTARRINPKDRDWERTHSGRYYSYKYGYGVMDAWQFVTAAKEWKLVKPQAYIELDPVILNNGTMDAEEEYDGGVDITVDGISSKLHVSADMVAKGNLERKGLEHITVRVWIDHSRRGDVEVEIMSPNGVKSKLAGMRERDRAPNGFPGWTFMSVKHWGEDPVGDWTIRVWDQGSDSDSGAFLGWSMILWGESVDGSKTKLYELVDDKTLPPKRQTTITPTRPVLPDGGKDGGKILDPKPTEKLPSDPSTPTESGWLPKLESAGKQHWLAGVVGFLVLLNVVGAVWYWRRRKAEQAGYGALADGNGETHGMRSLNGRTYDDEEDEGEESSALGGSADARVQANTQANSRGGVGGAVGVVPGPHPQARSTAGLGFHSGFLDDDDPMSAATPREGGMMKSANEPGTPVGELVNLGGGSGVDVRPKSAVPPLGTGKKVNFKREEESSSEEESSEEEEEDRYRGANAGKGNAQTNLL
ncbi:hypothetical protein FA15DRAFT_700441 [Coprinopsis marcescibilis]|uniref:P/Homo B domain-containing protein n=1 Tax=Coprinopsis marcescibilis TaxID=230819 RepID=A0A5C3LAX2_COPMA|nr:hypothetical protein FA15DRAFT_700441 [Coprinopsis marcescibilis]